MNKYRLADLSVLVALAAVVIWYSKDAHQASDHILNLILILPLTAIVLALCTGQFVYALVKEQKPTDKLEPVSSVLPAMALFCAFVVTLPWLGFDVGTGVFIAAFLWVHGERRPIWIVGYSFAFASIAALFFSTMLPYPMPMLILPS